MLWQAHPPLGEQVEPIRRAHATAEGIFVDQAHRLAGLGPSRQAKVHACRRDAVLAGMQPVVKLRTEALLLEVHRRCPLELRPDLEPFTDALPTVWKPVRDQRAQ